LNGPKNQRISAPMARLFDMDDCSRLPWRFYGAARTARARG